MTGINGQKQNKIILIDSVLDSVSIKKTIEKFPNAKIISFDYKSHLKLDDLHIDHNYSDENILGESLDFLQENVYKFSTWYMSTEISKKISYKGINLGKLFHEQTVDFFVNFIKKVYEVEEIFKQNSNSTFVASDQLYDLIKIHSDNLIQIKQEKKKEFIFAHDKVKINVKLGNKIFIFLISRSFFLKFKNFSDSIVNLLFGSKKNSNFDSTLLIELHTNRYKHFFQKSKSLNVNLSYYGRRRPAIWNFDSFKTIKNSNCKIITSYSLADSNSKSNFETNKINLKKIFQNLWLNETFFNDFFILNDIPLWEIIKPNFKNLIDNRISEISNEITLAESLFTHFKFKSIVILHEVGVTEQIVVNFAKLKKTPIILLQIGQHFDTPEAKQYNISSSVYPINADKFLVWGDYNEQDAIQNGDLNKSQILKFGSLRYDHIQFLESSDKNYILLATPGPAHMHVRGHVTQNILSYVDSIKKICEICTRNNLKLIIKPHPAVDELRLEKIVAEINPDIHLIATGEIFDLIKDCRLLIMMGNSTSVLEAQLFNKPVIYIPAIKFNFGSPSLLKTESCAVTNIDNIETILLKILNDKKYRNFITTKGTTYVKKYIVNQGTSSEIFLKYLKILK